jgi:hypothetical protein
MAMTFGFPVGAGVEHTTSASGFACDQCNGCGRREIRFPSRGGELAESTLVPCSNCGGLGCVELAKWATRNGYTIARRGDVLTVRGRRSVLDNTRPPIVIEARLGVVLFWALAREIGTVTVDSEDKVDEHGSRTPYRADAKGDQIVEDIAACSRPLCRLPDLWEAQIDARLTEVVIDEVVGGRPVRRMGTLVEVARSRVVAARVRVLEALEACGAVSEETAAGVDAVAESTTRYNREIAAIRASIAGVDSYEPEWAAAWWLALREWTSAGKEPDPDTMADILRGLVGHPAAAATRDGRCICDHNPDTSDGPEEDCPVHGWGVYEIPER